jgi:uncharacterized protein YdaU (DUF1376 family)
MSKKTDIWMPFYVADYLADTQRLTTEQHGAYLLLILDYWRNGPPPDDDRVLAQITRLSIDSWLDARSMLEACFNVADGYWRHGRVDKELEKAKANKDFAQTRARLGAEAMWKKRKQAEKSDSIDASSMQQALLQACTSPSPSEDIYILPSGDGQDSKVPYDAIVDLYNSICTDLSKCQNLSDKRKKRLAAQWKKSVFVKGKKYKCNDLQFWENYFLHVHTIDWLNDRTEKKFNLGFEYVIREEVIIKLCEAIV